MLFEVLDNLWNFISFFRKKVKYGNRFHVKGRIFVHGKKAGIVIGDDVTIYSVPTKNPTSGFQHTYLRSEGKGSIVVGNRVGMSHVNITSFNNVTIEDDVLIGSGVKIWDTDFHSVDYENRMVNKNAKSAPIKIKKGAFIGGCSIILKGVTIGERSVVGAGSVVTKDIPADEIWAGNPAKYIRKLGGVSFRTYFMHSSESIGRNVA